LPIRLSLGPEPDWSALGVWLSALLHARGNEIVRVKGVVRTPAGRLLLQTVRKVVQPPEILPVDDSRYGLDNGIVVIGRGFDPNDLRLSFQHFTGVAQS
jgi:G3E family GTPase